MVAHETGQIATGDEPLNNIARVSNSREGRVSNSGINVINGKKTKNTEDCFDNSITGVCAIEKTICSNDFCIFLAGGQIAGRVTLDLILSMLK